MNRVGGCLCGQVRFDATDCPTALGICHCPYCQRWTGSALIGVSLPDANVRWTGTEHIRTRQTTPWAERAWCDACGSGLFFRVTDSSTDYAGEIEIPVGLFDDRTGFELTHEIYIDHKPNAYSFEGKDRKVLTRAECVARFALLDSD